MKLGFNLHLSPKHMFFFLHYTTLSGFCSLPRKKIKEEKNTAAKLRVRGNSGGTGSVVIETRVFQGAHRQGTGSRDD